MKIGYLQNFLAFLLVKMGKIVLNTRKAFDLHYNNVLALTRYCFFPYTSIPFSCKTLRWSTGHQRLLCGPALWKLIHEKRWYTGIIFLQVEIYFKPISLENGTYFWPIQAWWLILDQFQLPTEHSYSHGVNWHAKCCPLSGANAVGCHSSDKFVSGVRS